MELTQDWYNPFIEELKEVIVEKEFTSRWEIVECYHAVGMRILEENENFEREKIYGEKIVQRIAKSLGKSPRTISYSIQFAKMFPTLNLLEEDKTVNWTRIVRKYLTAPKEEFVFDLPEIDVLAEIIRERATDLSNGAVVKGNRIILKMPVDWTFDNTVKPL